jgi:hypothetical protein
MKRFTWLPWLLALICAHAAIAQRQAPTPTGMAGSPASSDLEAASSRPKDVEHYDGFIDRAHLASGKDPAKLRAEAIEQSSRLVSAMHLPCDITDAAPVGRGKATVDGKKVEVGIYEVACRNGLGFLLVARGQEAPYATSCFSADRSHAALVAAGRKSDMYCQLPESGDIHAMATGLMSAVGAPCTVTKAEWFGRSAAAHTEFTEVVCDDARGFLLQTPHAGATDPPSAMSCRDAAQQRIKCRLTDGGPLAKPITVETFKEYLSTQDPECHVDELRIIAQEAKHDRYLVEVKCSAHPQGLVAMIPLNGNASPYESMDCATAARRSVQCEYRPK